MTRLYSVVLRHNLCLLSRKTQLLPFMVHPLTAVHVPVSSHATLVGVGTPLYPMAQVTFEVPRYVVEIVPVKV